MNWISKYYSLTNITQCKPSVACKLAIPAVVVNLSSLMYTLAGISNSLGISFVFTLKVASIFSPYFPTISLNDKYFFY